MQHKACRRGSSLGPVPESFGDQVTADHIISRSTASQGLTGEKNALVLLDRATGYIECYPLGTKSSSDTWDAFNEFLGPAGYIRSLYTDDSPELIKTAKDMKVPLAKAIPGRPSTNGVAERAVRSVVEGARTILEHAGLPARFWKYAVRHWCFSRNVSLRSGESSWNLRFGQGHFKGPKLPFGCLVDFMPTPEYSKKATVLPKFGPKAIPGVFLGYFLQPGGRHRGDYLVAELKDFQEMDLSTTGGNHVRVHHIKDLQLTTSDVQFPMKDRYDSMNRAIVDVGPPPLPPPAAPPLPDGEAVEQEAEIADAGQDDGARASALDRLPAEAVVPPPEVREVDEINAPGPPSPRDAGPPAGMIRRGILTFPKGKLVARGYIRSLRPNLRRIRTVVSVRLAVVLRVPQTSTRTIGTT